MVHALILKPQADGLLCQNDFREKLYPFPACMETAGIIKNRITKNNPVKSGDDEGQA
jgi:hypothetical protein